MSDTKKPAARVSLYPVSAAIWRNETAKGVFYNFTLERSYRNKGGEWQASSCFSLSDALLVAKVADLAHSKINELLASDRQANQSKLKAA